ncbi:hypothetical protein Slala02_27420 [Streptomyces lavendulae subsp. lavendulae]|nr:hypothetical protein Slala01_40230 [Streptomyces lavendulae subsp. lavendulae]GLX26922.1 hypothetical protein Slala02_27420 [Streptomyces lavendulae subsp. lavendulae]
MRQRRGLGIPSTVPDMHIQGFPEDSLRFAEAPRFSQRNSEIGESKSRASAALPAKLHRPVQRLHARLDPKQHSKRSAQIYKRTHLLIPVANGTKKSDCLVKPAHRFTKVPH